MRLGKAPARPGAVKLRFSSFFKAESLPTPPATFVHGSVVKNWGLLANDRLGDCVFAGAGHEHMLWTRGSARFVDANVIADYSAVTGYDGTDASDQGTDLQQAASYRRKVGIADAAGKRHQIAAYMELRVGDFDQLILASWLFGAAGCGILVPNNLEDQFDARQPWSVTPGTSIVGGHYVPVVGRDAKGNAIVVTWGRQQAMTREFYEQYNDESIAYFCPEYVDANKLSPEGFDADALGRYLKELSA